MIRRDYIIRAIEQFGALLAKITGLAGKGDWGAAQEATTEEFQRLTGLNADQIDRMSDVELLAAVMEREPMLSVETKVFMLATLLKSSGDVFTSQGRTEEARQRYLKGLHLLLGIFGQSESVLRPDFAPTIEVFLAALGEDGLPLVTRILLMRHYEQSGQFGKAEDALFAMLEGEPPSPELLELGRSFYQRLLAHSDAALEAGNLPRAEAEAGLAQLRTINEPQH